MNWIYAHKIAASCILMSGLLLAAWALEAFIYARKHGADDDDYLSEEEK